MIPSTAVITSHGTANIWTQFIYLLTRHRNLSKATLAPEFRYQFCDVIKPIVIKTNSVEWEDFIKCLHCLPAGLNELIQSTATDGEEERRDESMSPHVVTVDDTH